MSEYTYEERTEREIRYEKHVENLLSLWLQGLYAKRQLCDNWINILKRVAGRAKHEEHKIEQTSALICDDLLALIGEAMERPRYVQLAGTLENGLGDAIAQRATARLMLIEAKTKLPLSDREYNREMKPPMEKGKGRQATFAALQSKHPTEYSLSRNCHFIVGTSDNDTLSFHPYAELLAGNGNGEIKPIDALSDPTLGIDAESLANYLFALLEAHESSSDAATAAWLVSEVVLLDHQDCQAHRVVVRDLCAVLFAKYGNDAMKKWVSKTFPSRDKQLRR